MLHRTLALIGSVALFALPAAAQVDEDWQKKAFAGIAAAEYRFSFNDGVLQAPNRANDLRTRLTGEGLSIESRTLGAEGFHVGLSVAGYGLEPVGPGIVSAGDRATNRRDGITEWLANDAKGLTHGLTLERRPREGTPAVRLALDGMGALPEGSDGKSVLLRNGKGEPVLRYGSLEATDAAGNPVPVSMSTQTGSLVIVVEDDGATWPITVKALASSPVWNIAINQANAYFGTAVATAGDVDGNGYSDVIVGAPSYDEGEADEGKVFVYLGGAGGLATSPAWTAQANQPGANMGQAVSTAGDVNGDGYGDVIVGAWTYDQGAIDTGAAFLWLGSASGLGPNGTTGNADWLRYGDQAFGNCGFKVARAGDVNHDGYDDILVSVPGYDNGTTTDDGEVLAFYGGPSGPSAVNWTLVYTSDWNGANFGSAIAGAGDVNGDGYDDVVIGAPHERDIAAFQGSVHLYYGSSTGLGAQAWAFYGAAGEQVGSSVAGLGDVNGDGRTDIGAGAPGWDSPPFNTDDGRIFVWYGRSGVPDATQNWSYSAKQDFAHLGASMAAAGDVNGDGFADIVAGADAWDAAAGADEGRAFIFQGSPSGPPNIPSLFLDGGQAGAIFGCDVNSAGDVNGDGYGDVIVGASRWNDAQADSGNARVYLGGPSGPALTANWSVTAGQGGGQFGYAVASAGDINGDFLGDVIVGANLWDNGQLDEGAAFVYLGSSSGLNTSPAFTIEGGQVSANLGFSVAGAGDVNGDGYGDVIVGAYLWDNPETNEGMALLYMGSSSGLTGVPYLLEVNQAGAQLGWSVASAGDVNGDGFGDILVGAELWDGTQTDQGAAFIALGSANGPGPLTRFGTGIVQAQAHFGFALAGAGDVNNDGFSDVIVGVPEWDGPAGGDAGKVYLFMGSAAGLSTAAASWSPDGGHSAWRLGSAVGSAGDVNGDGYADIIIGVSAYTNAQPSEGGAFVYMGGPSGPTSPPAWSFRSNQANAFMGDGTSVASAGDVNGDGYSDVVVGARAWQEGANTFAGKAWVFLGSGSGLSTSPAWSAVGGAAGNQFGKAVACAGDVDGDGYSDVLIGEWVNGDGGNFGQGKAHVFYGNGGHGRLHVFLQRNGAGTRIVSPLGFVDGDLRFQAFFIFGIPNGRTRAGWQVEVKPVGTAFNGAGLLDIPNFDTTGLGTQFGVPIVSGLSPLTSYHWRLRFVRGANPAFVRSPWFGYGDNSRTLTDFRTPCGSVTWYQDADGDLHGNPSVSTVSCTQPAGYVASGDDCNDASAAQYPGNPEACDGIDNNCDGFVDNLSTPVGSPGWTTAKSGGNYSYFFIPLPGITTYDVARGMLLHLRTSGGNYTESLNACMSDIDTGFVDNALPPAGDAHFYLSRGKICGVKGTYDEGQPSQIGSRDAEIAAGIYCP